VKNNVLACKGLDTLDVMVMAAAGDFLEACLCDIRFVELVVGRHMGLRTEEEQY
jgi:hypothetical protein